jgi:hypothetical protein
MTVVTKSQIYYGEYDGSASAWTKIDLGNSFNSLRLVWLEGDTEVRFSSTGDKEAFVDDSDKLIELLGMSLLQLYVKGTGKIRIYAWNNSK